MTLLRSIRGNLIECQKEIFKVQLYADYHLWPDINFNRHCSIISTPKKVISWYISYTLSPWLRKLNTDFTWNNSLFVSLKLTKNADLDKYKYSGNGIGFDSRSEFLFSDGSMEKNAIIFGAYRSWSVNIDTKNKDILIFGTKIRWYINSRSYISC